MPSRVAGTPLKTKKQWGAPPPKIEARAVLSFDSRNERILSADRVLVIDHTEIDANVAVVSPESYPKHLGK